MVTTIATLAELQAMKDDLTETYILIADIDASETAGWNAGAGFEPIGNNANRFRGAFYGSGYTISGLHINRPLEDEVGLFGMTDGLPGSVIRDVRLADVNITGGDKVGGLVGWEYRFPSPYASCSVSGSVEGENAGGLIGAITNSTTEVEDCESMASVVGGAVAGGLIGVSGGATVRRCSASGDVDGVGGTSANRGVGGVAGINSGLMEQCRGSGNVTGNQIGGLVGRNDGGVIRNCHASGGVTGDARVGGLCGVSLSTGAALEKCYATGLVTGTTDVGGLLGLFVSGDPPADCFWDTETSGQASDGTDSTATGKTTAELKDIDTYTDTGTTGLSDPWDMVAGEDADHIWGITSGYPFLQPLVSEGETDVGAYWRGVRRGLLTAGEQ